MRGGQIMHAHYPCIRSPVCACAAPVRPDRRRRASSRSSKTPTSPLHLPLQHLPKQRVHISRHSTNSIHLTPAGCRGLAAHVLPTHRGSMTSRVGSLFRAVQQWSHKRLDVLCYRKDSFIGASAIRQQPVPEDRDAAFSTFSTSLGSVPPTVSR